MRLLPILFSVLFAACVSFDEYDTTPTPRTYVVGGRAFGLDGGAVTLVLNGSKLLVRDGDFVFDEKLVDGAAFSVELHPESVGYQCTIRNGTGVVHRDTMSVELSCVSEDASLADLRIGDEVLSPAFRPDTSMYTVTLKAPAYPVTVTAWTRRKGAQVAVGQRRLTSGQPSPPIETTSSELPIDIRVIAPDGIHEMSYRVVVKTPLGGL